ncbi:MAG: YbbR-like domain-containing protein [Bilophila wadsworthia]
MVAFLLALGLWYTLNAREQIERVVEVRLDYKGLPTGLIVTGGQLNKVSVRLRGPQELLRSMTNREISYTMDLSGVTPGKNVIPLTTGENKPPELRAYEVLEVTPSRMILEVDKIMETGTACKSGAESFARCLVGKAERSGGRPAASDRARSGKRDRVHEGDTRRRSVNLAAEGKAVSEEVPCAARCGAQSAGR